MNKKSATTCLLLLFFFTFFSTTTASAREKLPIRVQMTLIKVAPLLEKHDYSKAVKVLIDFQKKAEYSQKSVYDHPEIYFVLGNCYSLLGHLNKARIAYNHAIERDPQHLGAWQNLAKTEYESEHYDKAATAFYKSYLLTKRTEPKFLYYSGVNLLVAEKYQACLQRFDTLLQEHPQAMTLQWKENLVYALLQAGKGKRAIVYTRELARGFTGKKQQRWQEILLQQYMNLNMRKEALKLAQTLSHEKPTVGVWWKGLAHIQLQYDHFQKALAAMTIYSFLTPSMTREEGKLLGDLYMQQGIPRKAAIYYEHCLHKKRDRQTIMSLARAYRNLNQPERALQILDTLPEQQKNQSVIMERGDILYSMQHYSRAATIFKRAAKLKGRHADRAWLMVGYSYWQLDEYENAEQAFSHIKPKSALTKEAKRALKQLKTIIAVNHTG